MDLKHVRQDYKKHELDQKELNPNPIEQFKKWFKESEKDENPEQTAMVLSTVTDKNKVSSRVVLLKEIVDDKFRFFTNYESSKGRDIEENPYVSLLFFWSKSEKQIRIEGIATKTSTEISDDYFYSRPLGSQAGAIASKQSSILESKDELIYSYERLKNEKKLERPKNWGGYDVEAKKIEFWQGGIHRLHDRFRYSKLNSIWQIDRLAP